MTFKLVWTEEMDDVLAHGASNFGSHCERKCVEVLAPLIAKQVLKECENICESRILGMPRDNGDKVATEIRDIIRHYRFGLDAARPEVRK